MDLTIIILHKGTSVYDGTQTLFSCSAKDWRVRILKPHSYQEADGNNIPYYQGARRSVAPLFLLCFSPPNVFHSSACV